MQATLEKQKTEIESQRKFKMQRHKLCWINLSILGLKLWRSDPINFSLPYSQIADLTP